MSKLVLLETIADVKRLYPNISDEDFDRLIRLDPTFQSNRDSVGKYGKWILNLFNKDMLDNEGHLFDLLSRFEEAKPQLQVKDVNRFKSMIELEDYLNDTSNYNELSRRQQLRKIQTAVRNTDIRVDAEKVFEDYAWEVWVPHTYEASCKLGQGARWCTATTDSDYYYKYYTHRGPLFILIDKYDRNNKYQFHFPSAQFMDKEDESIDPFDDILDNDADLREFFRPYILESWNLPTDITFDEDISVTLFDTDFYKILNGIEAHYYGVSREAVKGAYLYDILYSPSDYYELDYYDLTQADFDFMVEHELQPQVLEKLKEALDGELTYDALMEHSGLYDDIEQVIRDVRNQSQISEAQDTVMNAIEQLFRNEIDTEWHYNDDEGYYFELSGSVSEFIDNYRYYAQDSDLNLAGELKNWVGCKIKDELKIYHNELEHSGYDLSDLNDMLMQIL